MIVWTGFGWLGVCVPLMTLVAFDFGTSTLTGDSIRYSESPWIQFVAVAMAAIILFFIGSFLEQRKDKILLDPQTGHQIILKRRHSLMFIPLKYWSVLWIAIGVYIIFGK